MNQWAVIWSVRDSFIAGLLATLELFITAAIAGLIIGVALCYLTEYQKKTLNRLIIGFVSLMRAIPFLILAYLLYYGLPQVGISLGNQLIICLKDTAFLSIITVQEITAAANSVQATYFIPFNAFIVAIGLYWAISILLELLIKRLSAWGARRGMSHA